MSARRARQLLRSRRAFPYLHLHTTSSRDPVSVAASAGATSNATSTRTPTAGGRTAYRWASSTTDLLHDADPMRDLVAAAHAKDWHLVSRYATPAAVDAVLELALTAPRAGWPAADVAEAEGDARAVLSALLEAAVRRDLEAGDAAFGHVAAYVDLLSDAVARASGSGTNGSNSNSGSSSSSSRSSGAAAHKQGALLPLDTAVLTTALSALRARGCHAHGDRLALMHLDWAAAGMRAVETAGGGSSASSASISSTSSTSSAASVTATPPTPTPTPTAAHAHDLSPFLLALNLLWQPTHQRSVQRALLAYCQHVRPSRGPAQAAGTWLCAVSQAEPSRRVPRLLAHPPLPSSPCAPAKPLPYRSI